MPRRELAQALSLASAGRAQEAVAMLEDAAGHGEAEALYMLGLWRIEGRYLPRDTVEARRLIVAAERQGVVPAARTLAALLSLGIGGERDWPCACRLLESWRERDPLAARQLDLLAAMPLDDRGDPIEVPTLEILSERPWIARLQGCFSAEEVMFLRETAEPRFRPARAFDQNSGRFVDHPFRTATAAGFPAVFEWPAVHALNRRLARISGTEPEQGEPLQLLRYGPGQEYREHLDAVPGLSNQRILTMLVALADAFEGGATVFPRAGIEWKGTIGDALLFRNVDAAGRPDGLSIHAGAPVTRGIKLIASRWVRQAPPPPGEAFGAHEVLPHRGELRQ